MEIGHEKENRMEESASAFPLMRKDAGWKSVSPPRVVGSHAVATECVTTQQIGSGSASVKSTMAMAFSSAGPFGTKWGLFLIANVAISLAALGVLAGAEFYPRNRRELIILGVSSGSIAVPITYGVGGHWRYGTYGWQFWQPFRGGARFVLLQALSWIFFAFTGVPWVLFLFQQPRIWLTVGQWTDKHVSLEAFTLLPRSLLLFIGASGLISEVMMALSLLLFSTSKSEVAAGGGDMVNGKVSAAMKLYWSCCWKAKSVGVGVKQTQNAASDVEFSCKQSAKGNHSGKVVSMVSSGVRRCFWRCRRERVRSKVDAGPSGAYIALLCVNLTLATLSCTLAAACDFYTHWALLAGSLPGPISALFSWCTDISISNPGMAAVSKVAGLGSKGAAAVGAAVGTMGSAAGVAIGHAAAQVTVAKAVVALFCAACLCIVVPLTHGLGGRLRNRHLPWAFWQPFVGGLKFVVIQAVAWSLFAAALVAFGAAAYCAMFVTGTAIGQGLMAYAGFSGLASEILLAVSLVCFQPSSQQESAKVAAAPAVPVLRKCNSMPVLRQTEDVMMNTSLASTTGPVLKKCMSMLLWRQVKHAELTLNGDEIAKRKKEETDAFFDVGVAAADDCVTEVVYPQHWSKEMLGAALRGPWNMQSLPAQDYLTWALLRVKCWASLTLLYCPHYLFVGVIFLPFMLLPSVLFVPLLTLLAAVYLPTYLGQPHRTDRRTWEASKGFFVGLLEEVSVHHFGGLRIVRDSAEPFPSNGKYIFAYHPHGMYPATMSWFHLTDAWKRLFPSITPVALAATAVFYVPILRDLVLWVGTQEVSRKVLRATLRKRNAVFLCPGGQSELAYHCPREKKQVILCSRKRGFVREAMEAGASLVPVFCFGEAFALRNFFERPTAQRIQRFTYRRLGFPVPFMPVGVAGLLPLPRPEQIAIVVGKPIPTTSDVSDEATASSNSSNDDVDECKAPDTSKLGGCRAVQQLTDADIETVRAKYFQALRELFEKYKEQYGYGDVQLILKDTP